MYSFHYIRPTTRDEQIRAYSVELAIASLDKSPTMPDGIIFRAAAIEEYIKNGKGD